MTGDWAAGAASSRPLRNWLETSPRTVAVPPGRPLAWIDNRRAAVVVLAPGIGAELVEGVEQIADRPLAHAGDAVEAERAVAERRQRGEEADRRAAVGDRTGRLRARESGRRAVDDERACPSSRRLRLAIPSGARLSIITRVSSLSSAPVSVETPSASAAQTRARLVMLFDPGGRTRARIGPGRA